MSLYRKISAGGGDAALITGRRATLRKIFGGNVTNTGYLKLYDTNAAPTAGAGTPVLSINLAGAGQGPVEMDFEGGIVFFSGIGVTIVQGADDTDATAVIGNQCAVHVVYD